MFAEGSFYSSNQLLFLKPLMDHTGIDIEQFATSMREAAKSQPKPPPIMSISNGVAQVSIKGPLMPNKSLIMQAMGGTSTQDINDSFQQILRNDRVKGVLVHVNSGGGSAAGIDQTAELIHEVAQKKPIVAHINGSSASAAYYLTSQATKVFAGNRNDVVGSVGTRLVMQDTSVAANKAGVEMVVIDTGANKSIGLPGTKITTEHKSHMQSQVMQLQRHFEESVKRGRPLIDMSAINDGSVWLAEEAQQKGLIDDIHPIQKSADVLTALMRIRNS